MDRALLEAERASIEADPAGEFEELVGWWVWPWIELPGSAKFGNQTGCRRDDGKGPVIVSVRTQTGILTQKQA
jgi:hypothetical protein